MVAASLVHANFSLRSPFSRFIAISCIIFPWQAKQSKKHPVRTKATERLSMGNKKKSAPYTTNLLICFLDLDFNTAWQAEK